MNRAMEDYLANLEARDRREQAQKNTIDQCMRAEKRGLTKLLNSTL